VLYLQHHCIPPPTAGGSSRPMADILGKLRTTVQGDDANVMDHLRENHHIPRSLNNLIITVISCRHHWRSGTRHDDAARADWHVPYVVGSCAHSPPLRRAVGLSLLSIGRHG